MIGVSLIEKEEKYNAINNIWTNNNRNGLHSANVDLMRDALKLFPNDALLLVKLSTSLEKLDGTQEEKDKYLRESIVVQEQIINYCEDCEVRGATLYNICFAYWKVGEHEKAIEQAKKLPNLYKARENALVYFLDCEEKQKIAKDALISIAWIISHHLTALFETENNAEYLEKSIKILDILFEDKDTYVKRIYNDLIEKQKDV